MKQLKIRTTPTVADEPDAISSDLAEQLRRWIVVAGLALAAWAIVQMILIFVVWEQPFNRGFRIWLLMPIYRLAAMLYLVSPLILVAGCWGFKQHRRWARPVLLTYAGMWIAGVLGLHGVQFIDTLSGAYGDL